MKRLPYRLLCLLIALAGIMMLVSGKLPGWLPNPFADARQVQALGMLLAIISLTLLRKTREK